VRHLQHPSTLVFALAPLYGLFFSAGFACYVLSLLRLRRYLREKSRPNLAVPTEACLHVLAAIGIFLGRFNRLNTWDIFARPVAIAIAIRHLIDRGPLETIAAALIVLAAGNAVSVRLTQTLVRVVRRRRHLSGSLAG
jgi:uncharacterized membrane protein